MDRCANPTVHCAFYRLVLVLSAWNGFICGGPPLRKLYRMKPKESSLCKFSSIWESGSVSGPDPWSRAHSGSPLGSYGRSRTLASTSLGKQVLLSIPTNVACNAFTSGMHRNHTTVLLIDDEASQRRFMRRALEDAEYEVLEGSDFNEALINPQTIPGDNRHCSD